MPLRTSLQIDMQISLFGSDDSRPQPEVVNVAKVPQRSPFRYPGGKTWLVPTVRRWLKSLSQPPKLFIEPFAGGGIVSLTVAFESLADHVLMVELDEQVGAVWQTVLNGKAQWLADRIMQFDLTLENAKEVLAEEAATTHERAFQTILKNRIVRGGIMAKGSGFMKAGENGKGIASRWYPKTLKTRIEAIALHQHKIDFVQGDAFDIMETYGDREDVCFFIDPPYTLAGRRLYAHHELDHARLFEVAAQVKGAILMSYDDTEEVRDLAQKNGLDHDQIPMKTTHHQQKYERLISQKIDWLPR